MASQYIYDIQTKFHPKTIIVNGARNKSDICRMLLLGQVTLGKYNCMRFFHLEILKFFPKKSYPITAASGNAVPKSVLNATRVIKATHITEQKQRA